MAIASLQPLKSLGKIGKQKPRRLLERAGFSKKSMIWMRS